jgi:hypothetical protein
MKTVLAAETVSQLALRFVQAARRVAFLSFLKEIDQFPLSDGHSLQWY